MKDFVYVVDGRNKLSLLSKYIVFDLNIFQINNQYILLRECRCQAKKDGTMIQHVIFTEMKERFTSEGITLKTLQECKIPQPNQTVEN